jgi:hypothetical protein
VTQMREMPVKLARQIIGESESRIWRVLFAHVEGANAWLSIDYVVWMGADEINRCKGHNYLTALANRNFKLFNLSNSNLSFYVLQKP